MVNGIQYVPLASPIEYRVSNDQQSWSQSHRKLRCSSAIAGFCIGLAGISFLGRSITMHTPSMDSTIGGESAKDTGIMLAASKNQSVGQLIWDVILEPRANFQRLRNDVLISRAMAGVLSAAGTAFVGIVCSCTAQKSLDDEIAEKRWEALDAEQKNRFRMNEMDISLLLKRYRKGRFAACVTGFTRLVVAHLFPCYLVYRISSELETNSWLDSFCQFATYLYIGLYFMAACLLFCWSYLWSPLWFCITFVLPFSALCGLRTQDPLQDQAQGLWVAAQTDGTTSLVLTILSLVAGGPYLIAIGVTGNPRSGLVVLMTMLDSFGVMFSLFGYITSPSFWISLTFFTAVPGLFVKGLFYIAEQYIVPQPLQQSVQDRSRDAALSSRFFSAISIS